MNKTKIEWVQEITKACDKAGIPVFHKDNLTSIFPTPITTLRQEIPLTPTNKGER